MDQYVSSKAGDITTRFGFADAAKRNQARTNLEAAIRKNDLEEMKKWFHEIKNTFKDYNEMKRDGATMDTLKKMAGKTWWDVNATDMTKLIKSIEEWIEHKYPSSGWLFHERWAANIDDGFLQSQVQQKTGGGGAPGAGSAIPITVSGSKITINSIEAPITPAIPAGTTPEALAVNAKITQRELTELLKKLKETDPNIKEEALKASLTAKNIDVV